MIALFKNPTLIFLFLIFILGLSLRFLYFPGNIYFGFDQARDAFTSLEIMQGDFKIIGPTTSLPGLFHGPLYYYIFGPIYFFTGGNPEAVSTFLRIVNALGIFVIFFIGRTIFNRWVGLMSAFLFAISFEQTQFSIYLNHPALAVISVLIFYLGFALIFFKKKPLGFVAVAIGLGLSIQFEMAETYLVIPLILYLIIFRKNLKILNKRTVILSVSIFLLLISTFILAEIKFGFRSFITVRQSLTESSNAVYFQNIVIVNLRSISDNLISYPLGAKLLGLILLITAVIFIYKNRYRKEIIFLLIWFFSGNLPYIKDTSSIPLYYHIAGSTVTLLIFSGFLIYKLSLTTYAVKLFQINRLFILLLLIPVISNYNLITTLNPKGSIPAINVQSGMLYSDQKKVLDFIYKEADSQPFSVNALTMPFNINTVWSYMFEKYGNQTYGYVPVWGGDAAQGYPGKITVEKNGSKLPQKRFFIIEPNRGIPQYLIDGLQKDEDVFSKKIKEEKIGEFIVQSRIAQEH